VVKRQYLGIFNTQEGQKQQQEMILIIFASIFVPDALGDWCYFFSISLCEGLSANPLDGDPSVQAPAAPCHMEQIPLKTEAQKEKQYQLLEQFQAGKSIPNYQFLGSLLK
jgi:hypothetical protein